MTICLCTLKSPLVLILPRLWMGDTHGCWFFRRCHNRRGGLSQDIYISKYIFNLMTCFVASTLSTVMRYNYTSARGNSESGLVKQYNPCLKHTFPQCKLSRYGECGYLHCPGGGGVVYYEVTGEMPDFVLELIDEFAQGGSPSGHLTSSEQWVACASWTSRRRHTFFGKPSARDACDQGRDFEGVCETSFIEDKIIRKVNILDSTLTHTFEQMAVL